METDTSLRRTTILDAVRLWQGKCDASDIWTSARGFNNRIGQRSLIEGTVRRREDGMMIGCRFAPMTGGAMMASFLPKGVVTLDPPSRAMFDEDRPVKVLAS